MYDFDKKPHLSYLYFHILSALPFCLHGKIMIEYSNTHTYTYKNQVDSEIYNHSCGTMPGSRAVSVLRSELCLSGTLYALWYDLLRRGNSQTGQLALPPLTSLPPPRPRSAAVVLLLDEPTWYVVLHNPGKPY